MKNIVPKELIEKGIYWTDAWKVVSGCTKEYAACKNCWGENMVNRWGKCWGRIGGNDFSTVEWHDEKKILLKPYTSRKSKVYAVGWLGDLFHKDIPIDFIEEVFRTMIGNPQHVFLVLTKRPENMKAFLDSRIEFITGGHTGPPQNILLGSSVWDQESYDRVSNILQQFNARTWLSIEPLLGPITQMPHLRHDQDDRDVSDLNGLHSPDDTHPIDWVVIGGESTAGGRPCSLQWIQVVMRKCIIAGVPAFFKQYGEWVPDEILGAELNTIVPDIRRQLETHRFDNGDMSTRVGKKASGRIMRVWDIPSDLKPGDPSPWRTYDDMPPACTRPKGK